MFNSRLCCLAVLRKKVLGWKARRGGGCSVYTDKKYLQLSYVYSYVYSIETNNKNDMKNSTLLFNAILLIGAFLLFIDYLQINAELNRAQGAIQEIRQAIDNNQRLNDELANELQKTL